MKIAFVDPKGIHFGLNTGLAYLVSSLKKAGRDHIRVFDFNNNTARCDERLEDIRSYDVIGFSIKSCTLKEAVAIASKVKRKENVLVAGGPHVSLDAADFLSEHDAFDYAVLGEGERSITRLIEVIDGAGAPEDIDGIAYRKMSKPVRNRGAERILNLDDLPFPDYSDFDSIPDGHIYNYPLVTSRGCPHQCVYCCVRGIMGRRWVSRSVGNIIAELTEVRERYSSGIFNIQDDNFSFDIRRAVDFCDALVDENLVFKWSCPNGIRADRINEVLLGKMKKAGCSLVAFGIESANEKEFNSVEKAETLQEIVKAIRMAREKKIYAVGNFIIGLPHSNLDSIRESIEFAKEAHLESCVFNLLIPFPGTKIWEWIRENGIMIADWREGFTQGREPKILFTTEEFPLSDRIRAYYEANIKCHNYFAFMDEHVYLFRNIWNIIKTIFKYDSMNLHRHVGWVFRHAGRVVARIIKKNA